MDNRRSGELKGELRAIARQRRRDFVSALNHQPWTLPPNHRMNDLLDRGVALASYRPVGSEADPVPIEQLAFKAQAFTGYPRIDHDGFMRFYSRGPSGALVRNPLGFEEPAADGWPLVASIVLLPLLAFDRKGTRLGQGGGHYDRALPLAEAAAAEEGCVVLKIGIAWSVQEMQDLPREPWDIALDVVVTESEWISIV
jgi:5-formyltetrahydrofolate cyclo-ligase